MSEKAEPICANCKHYTPGQTFGKCGLSRLKYALRADSKIYSGCGLSTKPDFGCNQFEAKEETE